MKKTLISLFTIAALLTASQAIANSGRKTVRYEERTLVTYINLSTETTYDVSGMQWYITDSETGEKIPASGWFATTQHMPDDNNALSLLRAARNSHYLLAIDEDYIEEHKKLANQNSSIHIFYIEQIRRPVKSDSRH